MLSVRALAVLIVTMVLTSAVLQGAFAATGTLHPSGFLILLAELVAGAWTVFNYYRPEGR